MTKAELVKYLAGACDLPPKEISKVLDVLASSTRRLLAEGNDVTLPDIGKLKVSIRPARTGRNPKTGEAIEMPAKNVVKFVASKQVKEAVL